MTKIAIAASAASLALGAMASAAPAIEPEPRVRGPQFARAEDRPSNLTEVLADLNKSFEAFKVENEKKLADLKKGVDDVVSTEKMARIDTDITELTKLSEETKAALEAIKLGGGGDAPDADVQAHATAWNQWMRRGAQQVEDSLGELQVKAALTTQSDPDGGYLVPEEVESGIDRVLGTVSAIRSLARVVQIGTNDYKKLVNLGGTGSGWVGEEQARPETATPTLSEILISSGEIYANPAVTQRTLDDAAFNVETWLADEVAIEFAEQEGVAFWSGNGINKPRGISTYDKVANGSYAWGKLGFVKTGAAADFHADVPADAIIDLYYSLKSGYRAGAAFLTSDATLSSVRKFKDGQDNYLWAPPTADMPATVLGKPVYTDDNLDAVGAGAFPMAFGNFARGYLITDRVGIRVLRDPYTNKPYVHFYTTKRVGGGVVNFEAIKLLKVSA
jgi:HK97 family phage major capsid protein